MSYSAGVSSIYAKPAVPFYTPSRRSYFYPGGSAQAKNNPDRCWSLRVISTLLVVNSMNLSLFKNVNRSPRRHRAVCAVIAFALVTSFFSASSVHADSVRINNVVQTLSSYQGPSGLTVGATTATQDPGSKTPKTSTTTNGTVESPVVASAAKPDAAGVQVVQDPQQIGVEVIEEAEVEGTICDCGELLLPGGAFPKWPLLFLTAVPLVFIHDCDSCDTPPEANPTPTPSPNSTPTPTPEPASMLLLGTGLLAAGAGLRRRRNKSC